MALPFNLNTTTTTKAQGEKVEYIEPGAHQCKVTGLTTSDSLENYNGSPFIQYTVKNTSGKVGRCRFWVVKESDKPSTKEWKTKQIKDFLINAGVKDFSDDSTAMNAAINQDLMIAFISEEYIGINKETEEPVIRTAVKYRWSSKLGGKCTYNDDMNKTLSIEDMADFQSRHASWGRANAMSHEQVSDDDMPF